MVYGKCILIAGRLDSSLTSLIDHFLWMMDSRIKSTAFYYNDVFAHRTVRTERRVSLA